MAVAETGRLNFKGDLRGRIQPRVYDTERGPMVPESVSYDEDRDLTTIELVTRGLVSGAVEGTEAPDA